MKADPGYFKIGCFQLENSSVILGLLLLMLCFQNLMEVDINVVFTPGSSDPTSNGQAGGAHSAHRRVNLPNLGPTGSDLNNYPKIIWAC